jgi:dTDP-4-amino-4,6-dideoxygalactose transaminase
MNAKKIPFSGVGYKYSDDDIDVVVRAMRAEDTLTQGKYQVSFEKNFAKNVNVKHAFATSSAATAIELASVLFNVKKDDEIIIPAHTYAASAYPFARRGGKIIWADIDSKEFTSSENEILKLITDKTKVIVVVHLYGSPVDISKIVRVAKNKGIYVLEDCAQAIGASVQGVNVGTLGDAAVYSFQSHKNISTLGEGGMLTFNNDVWAELIPGLRHNGHRPFKIDLDMYWSPAMSDVGFDIEGVWPHNFCLGEIQCALGEHLLSKIELVNAKRRERYLYALKSTIDLHEIQWQFIPKHKISAHHLLPFKYITSDYKTGADKVFKTLSEKYLIFPAKQYYPLYRYELFTKSGNGKADVPITDDYYDNMVSLPFHHWMSDLDFEYLIESLRDCVLSLRKK